MMFFFIWLPDPLPYSSPWILIEKKKKNLLHKLLLPSLRKKARQKVTWLFITRCMERFLWNNNI
jgi:hypothetical protein